MLESVNVSIFGGSSGTSTDLMGKYQLKVKANTTQKVAFSFIGFETQLVEIPMLKMGQEYDLTFNFLLIRSELTTLILKISRLELAPLKKQIQSILQCYQL